MKLKIALMLGLALAGPVWAADPVFDFAYDDPKMNAAVQTARDSLDAFLAHRLATDGVSLDGSMLKVAVPIPGDGTRGAEHLWVTPFKRLSATEFVAIVQNDPAYIPALKVGDTLSFSDQQISDWAFYGDEGELFGGYTMRVTIAEFPDSANGTDMAEPPVPADW